MESDTLRCIQVKGHGLAGSFKDSTIVEWLQVHNPTELDYRKVSLSKLLQHSSFTYYWRFRFRFQKGQGVCCIAL